MIRGIAAASIALLLACAHSGADDPRAQASQGAQAFDDGRLEDAEFLLRRAVDLHRRAGDAVGAGRALVGLARVARARGRAILATGFAREAVAIFRQVDEKAGSADAFLELGGARRDAGAFDEAREEYLWAIAHGHAAGDAGREAQARAALAVVEAIRAEPGLAAGEMEKARTLASMLRGRAAAAVTLELGRARVELGDPAEAVALLDHAAGDFAADGDRRGGHAALLEAARAASEAGDWAGALARTARAVALLGEIDAGSTAAAASLEAATALLRAGRPGAAAARADEAATRYRRLKARGASGAAIHDEGAARAEIVRGRALLAVHHDAAGGAVGGAAAAQAGRLARAAADLAASGDSVGQAEAELVRGAWLASARDVAAAIDALARAIELASSAAAPEIAFAALALLGRVAEEQLDNEEDAARYYDAAIGAAAGIGVLVDSPGRRDDAESGLSLDPFFRLARLRVRQARRSGDQRWLDGARAALEAARTHRFLDLLGRAGATLADDAQGRERARVLAGAERAIARRLGWAALPAEERRLLRDSLARARADRAQIEESSLRFSLARPEPATFAVLRRTLAPDELLLEYALGPQGSLLIGTRKEGQQVVDLPPGAELSRHAIELYRALAAGAPPGAAGEKLAGALLDPALDLLRGVRRVIVVPDGALALVPFGVLAKAGEKPPLDGVALAFAPSVGAFVRLREAGTKPRAGTLVALGDPSRRADADALLRGGTLVLGVNEAALSAVDLESFSAVHLLAEARVTDRVRVGRQPRVGDLTVAKLVDRELGTPFLSLGPLVAEDLQDGGGVALLVRACMIAGARNVLLPLWDAPQAPRLKALAELARRLALFDEPRGDTVREALRGAPGFVLWGPR